MARRDNPPGDAAELRREAEEIARRKAAHSLKSIETLSTEEVRKVLHELDVHQIELELQNEELRRAQAELEASRARYFDLYDLAPVGYCTLSEKGLILEVNLAAAALLGVARSALVNRALTSFVYPEDQDIYYLHRKQLFETGAPQACEFRMLRANAGPFWAHVAATAAKDSDGAPVRRVVMSDITERKKAEATLRESEQRYHLLVDTAQESIVVAQDGLLKFVNPVTLGLLEGHSEQELIDRPFTEFIHPDDRSMVVANYRRRIAGEPVQSRYAFRLATRDGSIKWVEISAALIEWQGRPATLNFLTDVTERKRAEEERQSAREFLDRIINAIADPVFVKDDQRRFVLVNDALCAIVGRPREALLGEDGDDMFPEDQVAVFRKMDAGVLDTGNENVNEESLSNLSSGEVRTIVTRKTRYIDPAGRRFLVGVIRDFTERTRVEAALRESEGRYRSLVELAPDAIYTIAPDGTISSLNQAFEKITGWSCEEWLGRPFVGLVHPDDLPGAVQSFECSLRGEFPPPYEMRIRLKTGGYVVAEFTSCPLVEDGRVIGELGMARDITNRKRAEEERDRLQAQLLQAQKMESVGRLAGGVAHDFNNQLQVIFGYTTFAQKHVDPHEPLYADLEEIRKAAQRSADLTRQLLAFARKQTIAPEVLDLNVTIESILKMLRRLIGEAIDLAWLPGKNLWPIKVDPAQIDQILANLCVNARDAIGGVGKITIETRTARFDEVTSAGHVGCVPGEYVMLGVSDDGRGMDKETLDRVFEPFFTTKGAGEGTGLGLAMVHGIVTQNKGFISVQSEPGEGTTFWIYLPRHEGEAVDVLKEPVEETPRGQGETVLVVEDEVSILRLARRMLEGLGYVVLTAGTPGDATRLAEEHTGEIHLLMTDVVMPQMTGKDLAERIMGTRPGLRCLYMSGYTADVIAPFGVLEDGVRFMQKPFTLEDLARKVREALEG
ncbi:PAS domain S-box protein [Candidatus Fermentibacteria bacterium]|nr:PAS domain S-box protein [Candidatus Fermentibacteria bacterium]